MRTPRRPRLVPTLQVLAGATVAAPMPTFAGGIVWFMFAGYGWVNEVPFVVTAAMIVLAGAGVGVVRFRHNAYQGMFFVTASILGAAVAYAADIHSHFGSIRL